VLAVGLCYGEEASGARMGRMQVESLPGGRSGRGEKGPHTRWCWSVRRSWQSFTKMAEEILFRIRRQKGTA